MLSQMERIGVDPRSTQIYVQFVRRKKIESLPFEAKSSSQSTVL